jgi:hypothetical protein
MTLTLKKMTGVKFDFLTGNEILTGVKIGVKKHNLCYLRVSKNAFDSQGVKWVSKNMFFVF